MGARPGNGCFSHPEIQILNGPVSSTVSADVLNEDSSPTNWDVIGGRLLRMVKGASILGEIS